MVAKVTRDIGHTGTGCRAHRVWVVSTAECGCVTVRWKVRRKEAPDLHGWSPCTSCFRQFDLRSLGELYSIAL